MGLGASIVVRFVSGALLLSVLLGVTTYATVRRLLIDDREANSVEQAVSDALLISATLRPGGANPTDLLAALEPPTRSTALLLREGEWFAASLQVRPEDLPVQLTAVVISGTAAKQRVMVGSVPSLVVGLPLPGEAGSYFEVFSLLDIRTTMSTLLRVLIVAGAFTTLAGAVMGRWIATRLLAPLRQVTDIAQRIAAGQLDSRLDEALDPDLASLAASFNRMVDTVQTRIALEARFASDAAHELRTPLTTLFTSLSVLEGRAGELSKEGAEALGLMGKDVRRLEATVADLVEITKHDAGLVVAELDEHPTTSALTGLLNRMGRHDISVDIDQRAARALVRIDERRLERALANLIDNATRYAGGVHRIVVEGGNHTVRIAVEDNGPGVPFDERARIFERFARGPAAQPGGEPTGSGLGLALAAENVRLQGGRIWVEGGPGGGSRFVIEVQAEWPW